MSILARKLRRDMRRSKVQFLAAIVTVFLGVVLFGASYDAFQNLKASYDELYRRLDFADVAVTGDAAARIAAESAAIEGVTAAETRLQVDRPVRVNGGHKLLGRLVSVPPARQPAVNGLMVLDGAYLDPRRPAEALVEQHMADHFGLAPGDGIEILGVDGWQNVRVAGVVASAEYVWPARSRQDVFPLPDDFGVLFVSHELAGALTGNSGYNSAVFSVAGPVAEKALVKMARELGASETVLRAEQPSNEALSTDVQGFGQLSLMFPILFLSAAGMATYILLTRIVNAQRPLIGTLMANGFRRRSVLTHYMSYGILAGLAGAVPAAIAGLFIGRAITSVYTSAISVPLTVSPLHWETPAIGILFGLLTGAVAAAGPAYAASRVPPAEAMRGPTPIGRGRISIAERLLPPLRRLPIRWRLVLRGIERSPRRTLFTAVGIVLALTLILVSWGMLDTMNALLDRQFNEVQRQDAQVYLAGAADDELLTRLRAVPGVAVAEPLADFRVSIRRDDDAYVTSLLGLAPDTRMHEFRTAAGERVRLPAEGFLAGSALQDRLGVRAGDTVTLRLAGTGLTLTERIAGFVDEPLGTYSYIALPRLETLLREAGHRGPAATAVLLRYEPGVDRAAMRDSLTAFTSSVAYVDTRGLLDTYRSFVGLYYIFVGVMLSFGGAMAFALIFNTMSVNNAERTVEIAMLRAAGVGRGDLFRIITFENLLMAAIGVAPGLVVGHLVARVFMASYSSDLFSFELHMLPTTPIFAAAAVMIVALLSQWPGLRALSRLDIAAVVRERAT